MIIFTESGLNENDERLVRLETTYISRFEYTTAKSLVKHFHEFLGIDVSEEFIQHLLDGDKSRVTKRQQVSKELEELVERFNIREWKENRKLIPLDKMIQIVKDERNIPVSKKKLVYVYRKSHEIKKRKKWYKAEKKKLQEEKRQQKNDNEFNREKASKENPYGKVKYLNEKYGPKADELERIKELKKDIDASKLSIVLNPDGSISTIKTETQYNENKDRDTVLSKQCISTVYQEPIKKRSNKGNNRTLIECDLTLSDLIDEYNNIPYSMEKFDYKEKTLDLILEELKNRINDEKEYGNAFQLRLEHQRWTDEKARLWKMFYENN